MALSALLPFFLSTAANAGDEDYAPTDTSWNGTSELVRVASDSGVDLRIGDELDLDQLASNDALVVIGPVRELPSHGLREFLRNGGQLVIADDFGPSDAFLRSYRFERHAPGEHSAPLLRDNPDLPIAEASGSHALSNGLLGVATNHPVELSNPTLSPILALRGSPHAIMLGGLVDKGRLIAIGDPSIFINNMMRLNGNRLLAQRLLQYLAGESQTGTVWLATGSVRWTGANVSESPIARARRWLSGLSTTKLPPLAIQLGSATLLAILLLIAATALPRLSPYRSDRMFHTRPVPGGFSGRVGFYADRPNQQLQPLLRYKLEFESALVRTLGLENPVLLKDIMHAARERGIDDSTLEQLRNLLVHLDAIYQRQDHPPSAPKVRAAEFVETVNTGTRILETIERARQGTGRESLA